MRFRTGLIVGLAVGYYYGSKAGRERHEQIERYLDQVRDSEAYRALRERVEGLVDDGLTLGRSRIQLGDPTLN